MPSPWFDVPFLFGRIHLVASHTSRKETVPAVKGITVHEPEVVVTGAFRLQGAHGVRPYFKNDKVSLRVQGRLYDEFIYEGGGGERLANGSRTSFSGLTTPAEVRLELYPDDKNVAYLHLGDLERFTLQNRIRVWDTLAKPNHATIDGEFSLAAFLEVPFPHQPGEVRLDKAKLVGETFSCCGADCEIRVSGRLRLTADIPVFHLVDDTLDANPLPHCRVRVLCPDGVEREYESDEAGDIFIPRAGKDVHTLLEILHDSAPQSAAAPGAWTVDVIPELA